MLPRYNIEPAPMGIYKFHGGDGRPYKLPKVCAAIVDLNKVQAVRPPRSAMEPAPIRTTQVPWRGRAAAYVSGRK